MLVVCAWASGCGFGSNFALPQAPCTRTQAAANGKVEMLDEGRAHACQSGRRWNRITCIGVSGPSIWKFDGFCLATREKETKILVDKIIC